MGTSEGIMTFGMSDMLMAEHSQQPMNSRYVIFTSQGVPYCLDSCHQVLHPAISHTDSTAKA